MKKRNRKENKKERKEKKKKGANKKKWKKWKKIGRCGERRKLAAYRYCPDPRYRLINRVSAILENIVSVHLSLLIIASDAL